MDIFNLMKNFGIVLCVAFLINMLNDLTDNSNKLLDAATELNAATTTMNQTNQKLLELLNKEPTIALSILNKEKFTLSEFNNLKAVNKIEAARYITETAAAIEQEIIKETINDNTVINVNSELEILNEKAKNETI